MTGLIKRRAILSVGIVIVFAFLPHISLATIYVQNSFTEQTIQTQINALGAGGGIIVLQPVTYLIAHPVNLSANVELQGSGWATILQAITINMSSVIQVPSSSFVRIDSLMVDCNGKAKDGIYAHDGTSLTLSFLYILNCKTVGLHVANHEVFEYGVRANGNLVGVYIEKNGAVNGDDLNSGNSRYRGVWVDSGTLRVNGLYVANSWETGVYIHSGGNSIIASGFSSSNGGYGFRTDTSVQIINFNANNNGLDGFYIAGSKTIIENSRSTSNGFSSTPNVYSGFVVSNANHVLVTNCEASDIPNGTQAFGFKEQGTSDYNLFLGDMGMNNIQGLFGVIGIHSQIGFPTY